MVFKSYAGLGNQTSGFTPFETDVEAERFLNQMSAKLGLSSRH